MAVTLRFLPPIPDGFRLLAQDVEVAGVSHHKEDVLAFARGANQEIAFVPEPDNPHDSNAIAVTGTSSGFVGNRRVLFGHVPADLAKELAKQGLSAKVLARLRNIWISDTEYVIVRFDVMIPKEAEERKPPPKPKKLKVPTEAPPSIDPIYRLEWSSRPQSRRYCEKCKDVYVGFSCRICGTEPRGWDTETCDHCNTERRASRNNCPICTVQQHLDKADKASEGRDLIKAISFWHTAYIEARQFQYGFSYTEVVKYSKLLAEAGFATDAYQILSRLRAQFGTEFNGSARGKQDCADYFLKLAGVHQGMATVFSFNQSEPAKRQQVGVILFSLLGYYCYESYERYMGVKVEGATQHAPTDRYYMLRMQDVLRTAKLNKKGRPEELQAIFVKHWATLPHFDTIAVQKDVLGLLAIWEPS
jgi:HIRAN domain